MVEASISKYTMKSEDGAIEEPRLQSLLSRLFIDRKVEFFDAEPDEEFINVFDHVDSCPIEERRKALEEFRHELELEECFAGDYGQINEILIQSEDFVSNFKVPFLNFNLSYEEDKNDPAYAFRLDLFEVFYVGDDRFLVVFYVRNVRHSHMEMYMRFTKDEAIGVVRAILSVYETYMGYNEAEQPGSIQIGNGQEEFIADEVDRIDPTPLGEAREAATVKFKELRVGN
jgi:hypothetical protein